MARLIWVAPKDSYEAGVDRAVVYFADGTYSVWPGIISINQSDESDVTEVFFEGEKVSDSRTHEMHSSTIECYTFPSELFNKAVSGLTYRTSNDEYNRVHIVYGPVFLLSSKKYATMDESAQPTQFSVEMRAIPRRFEGFAPTSHVILESFLDDGTGGLARILGTLYGTDTTEPYLLSSAYLLATAKDPTYIDLEVVPYEDSDVMYRGVPVVDLGNGEFSIDHARVAILSDGDYSVQYLEE